MRSVWIVLAVGLGLSLAVGYWIDGSSSDFEAEGIARPGAATASAGLDRGPLFPFESLYLAGRSAWSREVFRAERARLRELPDSPPAPGTEDFVCEVAIRTEPLSSGDWLEELSEAEIALRLESEQQVVDTRVTLRVPGVSPGRLLLFLAASEFRSVEDSKVQVDWVFPGEVGEAGCELSLPALARHEFLTRERTAASGLRKATDVWFVNSVGRDGDGLHLVYEQWGRCGDESHAPVRFASGTYAVAACEGGSRLVIRSLYQGQLFASLATPIVRNMTRSYYASIAEAIVADAPGWEPPERARSWFESLRLEPRVD